MDLFKRFAILNRNQYRIKGILFSVGKRETHHEEAH